MSPLLRARIIWVALLFGQITFAVVITILLHSNTLTNPIPDPSFLHNLFLVSCVMIATTVPLSLLLRRFLLGSPSNYPISSNQFTTATIIPLALLEGTSFFGLVLILLSHTFTPFAIIPLIAILTQLFLFPSSRPIQSNTF